MSSQMTLPSRIRSFFSTGYDAIRSTGKRKAASTLLKGEDNELKNGDRHRMLNATRSLARNFALVSWAIRKHLDYVTAFNFQMRTDDVQFNKSVERMMSDWSRPANCDAAGRHPFPAMLRMLEARRTVDGDVFVLKLQNGRLQAIEGDRIRQPDNVNDGERWFNGVRVNLAGASAEYALWNRVNDSRFEFDRRIPAQRMCHHGYFERFDQFRGISPLAAALNSFRDVYEGIDYALAKMKVEQLFALVFYRDSGTGFPETSGSDTEGYEVDFNKSGALQLDLDPGDRAEFLKTDNPGSNTREFMHSVLSIALKALDLPFNFFDEAHTNFFGSRSAWLLYDRSCQPKRDSVRELLRKITVWKFQQWILSGELRLPNGARIGDIPFEWVHVGMPWWDPAKEINGSVAAIAAGLDNPYRITKEAGRGEFEDNIDAIARAQEYAASKGVTLTYQMQPVAYEGNSNNSRGRQ